MRLFAALGPGDIVSAFRTELEGKSVDAEVGLLYSSQLIEYCRAKNISLLGISQNARRDTIANGSITLENQPMALDDRNGSLFHLSQVIRGLYLAVRASRYRANLALVASGSSHYFALAAFRLVGIPVIIDFHNALWPTGYSQVSGIKKAVRALDALFFRYACAGTIGVSEECGRQVKALTKGETLFCGYKCQFRRDEFAVLASRAFMADGRFRVAFVGRIEKNKGIFDLIEAARELQNYPVHFDVCGDGPAFRHAQEKITMHALDKTITMHGALKRRSLLSVYANCDAVMIPTTSGFAEGLPKVAAEAILCNKPLITSTLSHAIDSLGPAIVMAEPDQPKSYAAAILALLQSREKHAAIVDACHGLKAQFFDRGNSLPAAFDRLCVEQFKS